MSDPLYTNLALIWFLVDSGCRVAELYALRWADVQLGQTQGLALVRGKGSPNPRVRPQSGRHGDEYIGDEYIAVCPYDHANSSALDCV